MSKKLLTFLLEEIAKVRIICCHKVKIDEALVDCGGVSEVSIEQLGTLKRCPACGNELKHGSNDSQYTGLRNAVLALQKDPHFKIELVMNDDQPAAAAAS